MQIQHADLETCAAAAGVVVVIDVIRAFTTAAFAFAAGAREIWPVSGVDEALALRERFPEALVMGEVGGLPPPGFDYGNSPSALMGQDLRRRRLIQRTGAGTQGIVRSANAQTLLASSFVCAAATVRHLQQLAPAQVTLVSTRDTGEDVALAEYLQELLRGRRPDPTPYLRRVREAGLALIEGPQREDWPEAQIEQFRADLECCTALDQFDFALPVVRQTGRWVMRSERAAL